ncbi:putative nucleoside-diphosphate sugar epimerase [Thermobacillus composti KWC4]|uniref:Putative nucleoside-diphosphate sugar epimerase n=1 Tax=Thermobacillus composti (strain DSM 18247 / JCM 13945 / KWC4) TaxID=717605 RepID=L0EHW9_THECK|nr:nucleoside-diphosphate sugar epimerase/dehydratase [Thermobacillus composti]AGA59239.1 putative nucleoside-diphosphate sugar epimerase [Thermobacillus composti KWC4]
MSYRRRLSILLSLDSLIVITAIFAGRILLEASINVLTFPLIVSSLALLFSHHLYAYFYKLYKKAWEYASIGELIAIAKAVTLSIATAAIIQQLLVKDIYFRLLAVTWMLHMLFIGGSRLCWRLYRSARMPGGDGRKRTLIVGAGAAGTMVARQLLQPGSELRPVAFVDDDPAKHKLDILGLPVLGGIDRIERIAREKRIENIVIAIPSLGKKALRRIFEECAKTEAKTQIMPKLEDLATGRVSVSELRDVEVEDLLGREPVELDIDSISGYVTGRTILVTGAGGSIGSEICRQVAKFGPKKLVLLGHGENSIYSIEMELRDMYGDAGIEMVTEIADIQDVQKMMDVMQIHRPDVVYHAAAHKHVPLMERNPEEAVKNNLIGTMNTARAASWHGVHIFVMISTDKAVNPTSVMGASKRLAEMYIQYMDGISRTKFVAVRFGNVLGSRGSVIPRFRKQIEAGGPVTVTHPDMVRYFMTIPEASRLVIQAGALAKGGEIFVLDMGEPVKIVDLARNLIRMSGYSVEDIGIRFTGIRPGEKLFEELMNPEEVQDHQVYPKIHVGKSQRIPIREIEDLAEHFAEADRETLRVWLLALANGRTKTAFAAAAKTAGKASHEEAAATGAAAAPGDFFAPGAGTAQPEAAPSDGRSAAPLAPAASAVR